MVLRNNLYEIVSADSSRRLYTIGLRAGHEIYAAHFPGRPVTPGVCVIQTAVELAGEAIGRTLRLAAAKNIKFLAVLSPVETPRVTFAFDRLEEQADGDYKVQVTVADTARTYATLSMLLSADR